MIKLQIIILSLIIGLSLILRFYILGQVPPGIHADEASQGFNAFSILKTGKDVYGTRFPILFRANGSYQPPIYTYLAIIPTFILGNSIFAIRSVSAVSGVVLVILTFLMMSKYVFKSKKESIVVGLISACIIAISPWAIHFSRLAVEANIGVLIFAAGIFLLISSLKKITFFPWACLVLGLSTHAYYSERVIVVILLGLILVIFRKLFLKSKMMSLIGLGIFIVTLLPHLFILTTGALTKRFGEVSYGGGLLEFAKQFINHYLIYFSPKNLFFDPGDNLGRVAPGMGVFYPWMLIPFLAGLGSLFKNRQSTFFKVIGLILVIAPIPAGLTGNAFYPLRTLDYLWAVAIIISLGCFELGKLIASNWLKILISLGLIGYSLVFFGLSYFVLFKYEAAMGSGKPYVDLLPVLTKYKNKQVWIDTNDRTWGVGIRATYLESADPEVVQMNLISQMKTSYYNQEVNTQEIFVIDNKIFKPIDWSKICGKNIIVVGDNLAFNPNTFSEHQLKLEFIVPDYLGAPVLFGYSTTKLCK